jgi:hypothetical protein
MTSTPAAMGATSRSCGSSLMPLNMLVAHDV